MAMFSSSEERPALAIPMKVWEVPGGFNWSFNFLAASAHEEDSGLLYGYFIFLPILDSIQNGKQHGKELLPSLDNSLKSGENVPLALEKPS